MFAAVHRTPSPGTSSPTAQNHLLELLPRVERRRLMALGEPVQLKLSEVLCEPGEAMRHVWFPVDGFVSLVTLIADHPGLEVGMIGREGMLGAQLALGVKTSPLRAVVQGSGTAWRFEVGAFQAELDEDRALASLLLRYLYVRMAQLALAAACLRYHLIGPRLARWLLMSQDRAHGNQFHVTHEFLAYMLGVRRVGVTMAAGELQRAGLISYHRGEVTVLDRGGLERAACQCYHNDRRAYAEMF
jgi:CRP-like cAMP-binding protein